MVWIAYTTDKTVSPSTLVTAARTETGTFTVQNAGFIKPILGKYNPSSSTWGEITEIDACSSGLRIVPV